MSDDKYAVVVDGNVVDTAPSKKAAKAVLDEVPQDAKTEVREFDAEKDVVKPLPKGDANGILHLR